ncbi:MAG: YiiD C-terminal domain-containing protein [Longimicrobiales bacterium]
MTAAELERYLHDAIPLSVAMGVRVAEASVARVVLEAPLAPNLNHRATAFGGSVAALATLAGWALIHLRLVAEGVEARTVIQKTEIDYLAPIDGAFAAVADAPDPADWDRFARALGSRRRGRLHVGVRVQQNAVTAATLRGAYVALLHEVGDR